MSEYVLLIGQNIAPTECAFGPFSTSDEAAHMAEDRFMGPEVFRRVIMPLEHPPYRPRPDLGPCPRCHGYGKHAGEPIEQPKTFCDWTPSAEARP